MAGAPGGPSLFGTSRAVLTDTSDQNMAALRRSMARAKTFSLFLVIADGPARAEVRARLREQSGKDGVPELRFFADGEAGAAEVESFLAEERKEPLEGAVVLDADALVAKETPVLALNVARDRLGGLIAGPLVLVLAPRREAEFSRMAPDLFDVRSATYEVEAEHPDSEYELFSGAALVGLERASSSPARRAPLDAQTLRAMEASPEAPPASALADEWLRVAAALSHRDQWADALKAEEEALRLAMLAGYRWGAWMALWMKGRLLGLTERTTEVEQALAEALSYAEGERERADTRRAVARFFSSTGRKEEAFQVLQQEVLPVYQRSEDEAEYLFALHEMVEILIALGRYDEALRILKEKVLPLCERVGPPWLRAKTMADIALIEARQGQAESAIGLLQREVLPVLERPGNAAFLAVAQAQLATELRRRGGHGDYDEAKRLYHLALHNLEGNTLPALARLRASIENALQSLDSDQS